MIPLPAIFNHFKYPLIKSIICLVLLFIGIFIISVQMLNHPFTIHKPIKKILSASKIALPTPKIISTIKPPPLPAGLKLVSHTLQHTAWVGTIDHPTINGGMLNAADGTIIQHDMPVIKMALNKSATLIIKSPIVKPIAQTTDNKSSISASKINIVAQPHFDDHWATVETVGKILKAAVSSGKLDYVLKKTDEMGLPASVAVVPMLESRYQTQAISPKGAGGPWQIMPSTAKQYGISALERFEWEPATKAALTMLNELHQQFGNWELAFAAYNAGPQRVQNAIRKNPQATSIQELNLPLETQRYVMRMKQFNHILAQYPLPVIANDAS